MTYFSLSFSLTPLLMNDPKQSVIAFLDINYLKLYRIQHYAHISRCLILNTHILLIYCMLSIYTVFMVIYSRFHTPLNTFLDIIRVPNN